MANNSKNHDIKYIIFINSAIMIFLFILLYKAVVNNKLIIGLEISVFLIFIISYLYILFKNSNAFFIDIRLSFILGYLFYNLYTPIVYCFRQSEILDYGSSDKGWMFNSYDVEKSLFISILFLCGLLLALTFVENKKTKIKFDYNKNLIDNQSNKINFYLWLIIFIISFSWYMYPYVKMGFQVMNYDRWNRYAFLFKKLTEQLGIINTAFDFLFNNYLILISLFMMFQNTINNKNKLRRLIFIIITILYSIFILFIDLRRREVLIITLMCISYYFFQIIYTLDMQKIRNIIKKVTFSLLILLFFFILYQQYREYFKYGYTQGISSIADMKSKQSGEYKESDIYINEFGMVYLTNLSSAKYTPELFCGKSYAEAVIKTIPFISKAAYEWLEYDKDKETIDVWLSTIYTKWFSNGGGLGYSPASEAFLNFHYLGCLIIGLTIGLFLNLLYKKLYNNKYIIIYSLLFSLAFMFSRTSFLGFTREFFWLIFYYVFYGSIIKLISSS